MASVAHTGPVERFPIEGHLDGVAGFLECRRCIARASWRSTFVASKNGTQGVLTQQCFFFSPRGRKSCRPHEPPTKYQKVERALDVEKKSAAPKKHRSRCRMLCRIMCSVGSRPHEKPSQHNVLQALGRPSQAIGVSRAMMGCNSAVSGKMKLYRNVLRKDTNRDLLEYPMACPHHAFIRYYHAQREKAGRSLQEKKTTTICTKTMEGNVQSVTRIFGMSARTAHHTQREKSGRWAVSFHRGGNRAHITSAEQNKTQHNIHEKTGDSRLRTLTLPPRLASNVSTPRNNEGGLWTVDSQTSTSTTTLRTEVVVVPVVDTHAPRWFVQLGAPCPPVHTRAIKAAPYFILPATNRGQERAGASEKGNVRGMTTMLHAATSQRGNTQALPIQSTARCAS